MFIPFPEYRPDVSDYLGQHTQSLANVLPQGDGYGPMPNLQTYTAALPSACRGLFYARKTDGTISVFAGTINRLWKLNNTTLGWSNISKVVALTSISNASPAVFTLNSHGLAAGDTFQLTTTGTLPTGLSTGTDYYVRTASLTANTFTVSTTGASGSAVNTTGAGSGTHSMTYFYSDLPSTDQWQCLQFNSTAVALQANANPQAYDISSGSAFADLGGSPPAARYGAVIARQIVLGGLVSNPNRLHWSDVDGITTWTAGTGFANTVDLPDGGVVRGIAGGEFGLAIQESATRRLIYVPGAKPSFQIERLAEEQGLLGPYSIARAGGSVFFVSPQGFQEYTGGVLIPIGKERVDRTFLADLDLSNLKLLIGAGDPAGTRVFFAYKSVRSSTTTAFDTLIAYDRVLKRFSPPIAISGEYLAPLVKPGQTLDALDSISSSIDALSFSLDSVIAALSARLAGATTTHTVGFFDGSNLEALLTTPEQSLAGRKTYSRGFRPRTDAGTVYGSVSYRQTAQATASTSTETLINSLGVCPQRVDARYQRGRVRIPAGTVWTYAMGIEPDAKSGGAR